MCKKNTQGHFNFFLFNDHNKYHLDFVIDFADHLQFSKTHEFF